MCREPSWILLYFKSVKFPARFVLIAPTYTGHSRGLEPASDLLQTVRRRSGSPGMNKLVKKWVGDTYHAVSLSGPNRGEGSERNEARGQGIV